MKKPLCFALAFVLLLLAGCTTSTPISVKAASVVPSVQTATSTEPPATPTEALPTATPTEVPTTATSTEVPVTATPEATATPDYYNFDKFVPEKAQVNEASWNGVNFKLALLEVSNVKKGLVPEIPDDVHRKGEKVANIYFLADKKDIYNKVIVSSNTYVNVTFSNGEKKVVYEGTLKQLMLALKSKGWSASRPNSPIGKVQFYFTVPEEGMELTELKIAESVNAASKAVTLYEK